MNTTPRYSKINCPACSGLNANRHSAARPVSRAMVAPANTPSGSLPIYLAPSEAHAIFKMCLSGVADCEHEVEAACFEKLRALLLDFDTGENLSAEMT